MGILAFVFIFLQTLILVAGLVGLLRSELQAALYRRVVAMLDSGAPVAALVDEISRTRRTRLARLLFV